MAWEKIERASSICLCKNVAALELKVAKARETRTCSTSSSRVDLCAQTRWSLRCIALICRVIESIHRSRQALITCFKVRAPTAISVTKERARLPVRLPKAARSCARAHALFLAVCSYFLNLKFVDLANCVFVSLAYLDNLLILFELRRRGKEIFTSSSKS